MISGIVGLPGAGKTLHAVKLLVANAHAGKRRSLANFHCRVSGRDGGPLWDFALWDEIACAGNCLAVIDEAHMWFSSRHWTKTAQHELAVFQQSRKEGLDLIWVAQHEARVDVAIREVTAYVYRVRKIGGFHVVSQFTPDDMKKPLKRSVSFVDERLFNYYYSGQRIGGRDGEGYKMGASDALGREAGASLAERNGRLQLKPTHYRCQVTPSDVRYLAVDDPRINELIGEAWRASQLLGWGSEFRELVKPIVKDGRSMVELDQWGVPELENEPLTGVLGLVEAKAEEFAPLMPEWIRNL